jgi:tRNA pseudouridine55 synthase
LSNRTSGLILLNKPAGITSFRALDEIKKRLRIKKVGHTGTLDKFATGLLLVLTGKYTRLTPLFTHLDKEYISRIRFGMQTDTLDPEGKIIKEGDAIPEPGVLQGIFSQFTGKIKQVPPRFSAIHVNGERLYKKALRGEEVKIPEREVSVYILEQLSYDPPFLTLRIRCSGGTYVRALARDIGIAAGTCSYVTDLTRTMIGDFNLSHAILPSGFSPEKHILIPGDFIPRLDNCPIIHLRDEYYPNITKGVHLQETFFTDAPVEDGTYALFYKNHLAALRQKKGREYSYQIVFRDL